MSAGTGVMHSEFNASKTEPVHFLQIWIVPAQRGIAPGYEQKTFSDDDKRGRLRLVASPDGRDGSVTIHADGASTPGSSTRARRAPSRSPLDTPDSRQFLDWLTEEAAQTQREINTLSG